VAQGLRAVLRESRDRILMVLHRGVIAVILTELLRLSAEQRHALGIDLASIHIVARREEGWSAERLDWVEHLRSHPVPPLPA
jgi:broad specificity phosphatase PhoE